MTTSMMAVALFLSGLWGALAGWVVAGSDLLSWPRGIWVRRRDLAEAAMSGTVDDLDPPWGSMATDELVLPSLPDPGDAGFSWSLWRTWAVNYGRTCVWCVGTQAAVLAHFGVAVGVAVTEGVWDGAWFAALLPVPVLTHLAVTAAFNKIGVWGQ